MGTEDIGQHLALATESLDDMRRQADYASIKYRTARYIGFLLRNQFTGAAGESVSEASRQITIHHGVGDRAISEAETAIADGVEAIMHSGIDQLGGECATEATRAARSAQELVGEYVPIDDEGSALHKFRSTYGLIISRALQFDHHGKVSTSRNTESSGLAGVPDVLDAIRACQAAIAAWQES